MLHRLKLLAEVAFDPQKAQRGWRGSSPLWQAARIRNRRPVRGRRGRHAPSHIGGGAIPPMPKFPLRSAGSILSVVSRIVRSLF